jgi:hypothetical protein
MIKFLYKYMQIRPEFFDEPMLRATPVMALNDPFEGMFNKTQVCTVKQHHKNFYERKGIMDMSQLPGYDVNGLMSIIQSYFLSLGVVSFTEDHINPLMWSHYADEHKGMAIQFKTGMPIFVDSIKHVEGIGYTRFGKCHLGDIFEFPERILYRREKPTFEPAEEAEPESIHEFHWKKFNKSILFTKSNDWLYEKELRSIVRLEDADRIICRDSEKIREICHKHSEICLKEFDQENIQITYPREYEMHEDMGNESIKAEIYRLSMDCSNPAIHLFRINPECISGVYFGCKSEFHECIKKIDSNYDLVHLKHLYKIEIADDSYSLTVSQARKYR